MVINTKRTLSLVVFAITICLCSIILSASSGRVFANDTASPVFGDGSYSYSAFIDGVNLYHGCELSVIDANEAKKSGVPDGYTVNDNVIKMVSVNPSDMDMIFDFTALNYKRKALTGFSVRYYVVATSSDTSTYPDFRIPNPTISGRWVVGGQGIKVKTGEWVTVSLNENQLDALCIDGYLKTVDICLRTKAKTTMYIDSVNIETVELDSEAPIINVPVTEFKVSKGSYPVYITATDDSGKCDVEYVWSEGALDYRGRLNAGTHTCKVIASDYCDNKSTVTLTYIVTDEPDVIVYKITFRAQGFDDIIIEYSEETIDYLTVPSAPLKDGYTSEWEEFTYEKTDNQIVECKFKSIDEGDSSGGDEPSTGGDSVVKNKSGCKSSVDLLLSAGWLTAGVIIVLLMKQKISLK